LILSSRDGEVPGNWKELYGAGINTQSLHDENGVETREFPVDGMAIKPDAQTSSNTRAETTTMGALTTTARTSVHSQFLGPSEKNNLPTSITRQTENDDTFAQNNSESAQAPQDFDDRASFASTLPPNFTAAQREEIISDFSHIIMKELRNNIDTSADTENSRYKLIDQIASRIRKFASSARSDTQEQSHKTVAKAIGRLSNQIAEKCESKLLRMENHPETSKKTAFDLGKLDELQVQDRVDGWITSSNILNGAPSNLLEHLPQQEESLPVSPALSFKNSVSERGLDSTSERGFDLDLGSLYQKTTSYPGTVSYLKEHQEFANLIQDIETLIERYTSSKMTLIRQRVGLALRRGSAPANSLKDLQTRTAIFQVEWDLKKFLRENYPPNSRHLANIVTVTGSLFNAEMCTVGQYFHQTWPSAPVALLEALYKTLDLPSISLTLSLASINPSKLPYSFKTLLSLILDHSLLREPAERVDSS
jgi:hypothetical protein